MLRFSVIVLEMSILCGPYDSPSEKPNKARDEELLVFGYACKLYRNDAKAILENSGQLLIPWMGDRSLMVDRYCSYYVTGGEL